MADYFIGHHATMPGSGKTAQAVDAACCLEHGVHGSMMTSVPAPMQDDRPRRVRFGNGERAYSYEARSLEGLPTTRSELAAATSTVWA